MKLKIVLLIIPIIILISYILLYIWNRWRKHKKIESFANQDDLEWDIISQNLLTDNMFIIKPRIYPPIPLIEMNYGPMNATKFISSDDIKIKKDSDKEEDVYGDGNYFIQWSSENSPPTSSPDPTTSSTPPPDPTTPPPDPTTPPPDPSTPPPDPTTSSPDPSAEQTTEAFTNRSKNQNIFTMIKNGFQNFIAMNNIEKFTDKDPNFNKNASYWFDGVAPTGTSGYMMNDSYDIDTQLYKNEKFIKDNYLGEWVKIELPTPIYLSHIRIYKDTQKLGGAPVNYKLYGKNGMDEEWELLIHQIKAEYTENVHEPKHINPKKSYNKYAICVKKIDIGTTLGIDEFQLFGNETRVPFNAGDFYDQVLKSDDLQNPEFIKPSERKYEILDEIVPKGKNNLRKMQFDLPGSERIPPPAEQDETNQDLRDKYGKGTYVTMPEQSFDIKMQTHLYNNTMTLDDPISDAYLPYSQNRYENYVKSPEENNNEYEIISIYKEIFDRNPTGNELAKTKIQIHNNELDLDMLRVNLLNSAEYRRNIKLQSNDVSADMEYSIAKEDMMSYIKRLYFDELGIEPQKGMMLPLKDIYTYLQNNEFLFRAFLIDGKYTSFEKEVLDTRLLTKSRLSEIFEKYYILYDLKLSANDIKRNDILNRREKVKPTPVPLLPPKQDLSLLVSQMEDESFEKDLLEIPKIDDSKLSYDADEVNSFIQSLAR